MFDFVFWGRHGPSLGARPSTSARRLEALVFLISSFEDVTASLWVPVI